MCSDEGLRRIAQLPEVQHLTLKGDHYSERGLAHLKQMKQLKSLHIFSRAGLSDQEWHELKQLKQLRTLSVRHSGVRDEDAPHLMAMSHLERLETDYSQLSYPAIVQIREVLPQVKIPSYRDSRIKKLQDQIRKLQRELDKVMGQ